MITNYENVSKLYDHCGHYLTHNQQLELLECLKRSGNYPDIEIIESKLRRQQIEPHDQPTKPKWKNQPKPSIEIIHNYVNIFTAAKVLQYLGDKWTILRDVLELTPEEWMEIAVQSPPRMEVFALYTFEALLLHWSLKKGLRSATVGLLYDKLKEHGFRAVGGKLQQNAL
jgi:hypothetical protein